MIRESNNPPFKIATILKIRSKGEPSRNLAFAPGVLKSHTREHEK